MSRRPAAFSQADIARALKAFQQVNGVPGAIELRSDGSVRIIRADSIPHPAREMSTPFNPVDDPSDPLMLGIQRLKRDLEQSRKRSRRRRRAAPEPTSA